MENNEEQPIKHNSKLEDVFSLVDFQEFRRCRRLGKSVVRITQKQEDFNKPADGNIV